MQTFEVGDRIKVRWDETGNFFFAKILNKEDDNNLPTYDVLYEELVRGKQCIEKNVTSNRICPSNPVFIPATVTNKELSSIREGGIEFKDKLVSDCSIINSTAVSVAINRLFSEIGSFPDTWNLSENLEEIMSLYNELEKHIGKTEERLPLNELELLVPILNHWICLEPDFNFLSHFTCDATPKKNGSGSDSTTSWLTRGKGKQLLQFSRLTLSSSSLLLQLVEKYETVPFKANCTPPLTTSTTSTAVNVQTRTDDASTTTAAHTPTPMLISTFVSEEILERILVNCRRFIESLSALQPVTRGTPPSATGTTTPLSPPALKSDANKRNKSQPVQPNSENKGGSIDSTTATATTESKKFQSAASKKIVTAATSELLPLVSGTLVALQSTFLLHTQNQRLCASAQELCFKILQTADSGLGLQPSYEVLTTDAKTLLLLQSTQRSAISLLEIICRYYRASRPGILREFLPLLQAAYCSKCTMKSFQLNGYNRPNSMQFHSGGVSGGIVSRKTVATSSSSGGAIGSDKRTRGLGGGGAGEEAGNVTVALGALLTAFRAMVFDSEYRPDSHNTPSSGSGSGSAESRDAAPPPPPTATITATDSRRGGSSKSNKVEQGTSTSAATAVAVAVAGEKRTTRGRRGKSEPDSLPTSTSSTAGSSCSTSSYDTTTPSTATATTATSTSGSTMMSSSSGLKEINGYCTLFIYELLQRCSHKDTGSDYRTATLALAKELVHASRHPAWPIAPFLLNRFILRIVTDVTASVTGGTAVSKDTSVGAAAGESKRDVSSLTCFYLELLGSVGSELLPVIATVQQGEGEGGGGGGGGEQEEVDGNVALAVCGKLLKQLPLWNSLFPGLFAEEGTSCQTQKAAETATAADGEDVPVVGMVAQSASPENKKKRRKKGTDSTPTVSGPISPPPPPLPSLRQLSVLQIKSLVDIGADVMAMVLDATDTIGPIETDYQDEAGSSSSSSGNLDPPTDTVDSVSPASATGSGGRRVSGQAPPPAAILSQCLGILTRSGAAELFPPLATRPNSVTELQVLLRYVQCLPGNTLHYYFWLTYVSSLYKYEGGDSVHDLETLALLLWLRDCEAMSLAAVTTPPPSPSTSTHTHRHLSSSQSSSDSSNNHMIQLFVSKQISELRRRSHHSKSWHSGDSNSTTSAATSESVSVSVSMAADSLRSEDSWRTATSLEWTHNRYSKILVDRFFHPGFERILQSVLLLLSDPAPAIRCKVVKTLAVLMKSDERLMRRTAIRDAVVERFDDLAISVREEAVKLVGSFILSSFGCDNGGGDRGPDSDSAAATTTNAYLDGLVVRLRDRGVSVRKSAVTILREILLFQPNHPRYTELCVELLSRGWLPKEEDSIKDVIRTTFEQLWFVAPPSPLTLAAAPPLPVTPVDTSAAAAAATELPEGWTRRLIEAVGSSGAKEKGVEKEGEVVYVSPSGLRVHSVAEAWEAVRTRTDHGYANNGVAESKEQENAVTGTVPPAASSEASPVNGSMDVTATTTAAAILPPEETGQKLTAPPPIPISATKAETESTAVTSQPHQHQYQSSSSVSQYLLVTVQQLLSVLRQSPSSDWMVAMLRGVLHSPPGGVEEKKQAKLRRLEARQQCELLVEVLVELMLRGEEAGSGSGGAGGMDRGERLVAVIGTIAIFCEAHPPFVCKHLSALLPYLKGDNALSMSQEAAVCLHVTNMLLAATAIEGFSLNDRVSEISSDLCRIALKFGTANVYASVHCLAQLASRLTRDISPLTSLAKKCLSSIVDIAAAVTARRERDGERDGGAVVELRRYVADNQSARIQRCLTVLGAVCEHLKKCTDLLHSAGPGPDSHPHHPPSLPSTDREADRDTDRDTDRDKDTGQGTAISKNSTVPATATATAASATTTTQQQLEVLETPLQDIEVKGLPPSLLPYACVVAVRFSLDLAEAVRVRAVQALCAVFVFGPRMLLLPDIAGLLTELLEGDKYSDLVHWKLLQSLKDMLMAEEIRIEKGAAECLMQDCGIAVGTRVLGPSETDSDATVAGSVLQARLPSLLLYLSHRTSADIRYAALNLIGTLLRQGMICPLDVLAELVALQVDPEESIRRESLLLLQIEDEKHPTFLDNRVLAGMGKGVEHQCRVSGQANPVVEVVADKAEGGAGGLVKRSIFSPLYVSCIQPQRRRRLDFLLSLIRRCDNCFLVLRKGGGAGGGAGKQSIDSSGGTTSTTTPMSPANPLKAKGTAATPTPTSQAKPPLPKPATKKSLREALQLLQVCSYLCSTLAYLPYDVLEEPLHIIHWIGRNVTLTGAQLLSDMRPPLELFGAVKRVEGAMQGPATGSMPGRSAALATGKKGESGTAGLGSSYSKGWEEGLVLQENTLKAKLASIASPGNRMDMKPGRSRDSLPSITTKPVTAAASCCDEAPPPPLPLSVETLLVMSAECRVKEALLRLKGFLKCAYGLSDERCLLYNPDDKPPPGDRADYSPPRLAYSPLPADVSALTASLLPASLSTTDPQSNAADSFFSKSMDPEELVSTVRQIVTDFNRLLVLLEGDPDDFSVNQQHPKKRKGTSKAAAASSGNSDIDSLSVDDVSAASACTTGGATKRPRKGRPVSSSRRGGVERSEKKKKEKTKKRKRIGFSSRTGSDSEDEEEGEEDSEEFDPSVD